MAQPQRGQIPESDLSFLRRCQADLILAPPNYETSGDLESRAALAIPGWSNNLDLAGDCALRDSDLDLRRRIAVDGRSHAADGHLDSSAQVGALDGHDRPRRSGGRREARDRRCCTDHEALLGARVLARVVVEVARVVSGEAVRTC